MRNVMSLKSTYLATRAVKGLLPGLVTRGCKLIRGGGYFVLDRRNGSSHAGSFGCGVTGDRDGVVVRMIGYDRNKVL